MTIRRKLITIFAIFILLALGAGSYIMWQIGRTNDFLKIDVPNTIQQLNTSLYLDNVAQLIRYDDEILTQSARNYALTGDKKWLDRYNEYVPKLDLRIKQALEKGDVEDQSYFNEINASNLALIEMETQSQALASNGQLAEAIAVLDSSKYAEQKEIYKAGIDKYLAKRGAVADEAIATSTVDLDHANTHVRDRNVLSAYALGAFILIDFALILTIVLILYFNVIRPISKLKAATKKIAEGDLEQKLDIEQHDEIGELNASFNQMVVDLKESKTNIEEKIAERTAELEKLNKFMTGREIKMIELKDKIKELENENKK